MRYRRKPIDRSVIDAVLIDGHYLFADAEGKEQRVPKDDFERDYQPAHASPKPRKGGGRKRRGEGAAP